MMPISLNVVSVLTAVNSSKYQTSGEKVLLVLGDALKKGLGGKKERTAFFFDFVQRKKETNVVGDQIGIEMCRNVTVSVFLHLCCIRLPAICDIAHNPFRPLRKQTFLNGAASL